MNAKDTHLECKIVRLNNSLEITLLVANRFYTEEGLAKLLFEDVLGQDLSSRGDFLICGLSVLLICKFRAVCAHRL